MHVTVHVCMYVQKINDVCIYACMYDIVQITYACACVCMYILCADNMCMCVYV